MAKIPVDSARAETNGTTNHEQAGIEQDAYYIQATAAPVDEVRRVLKHGETFGVFDRYGDIRPGGSGEDGLYHEGTHLLSCLLLRVGRERPLFLSSTVREENDLLAVDLTNPDMNGPSAAIQRGVLHISRTRFLREGAAHERIRFRNYGLESVQLNCSLFFAADFADIFEVRGTHRTKRGVLKSPTIDANSVTLTYEGLDRIRRQTRLEFVAEAVTLSGSEARFPINLPPRGETTLFVTTSCSSEGTLVQAMPYDLAYHTTVSEMETAKEERCTIVTDNEEFNAWINRTTADLQMMTSQTPQGPYPYAGIPWFSTAFGRDGLITALECLWCAPALSRGVLNYLAYMQADSFNPEQDAEPGKILHETRRGEMAALGEIPFGRYYGSIDSTPLFVMLAGAYQERTGDNDFILSLWPHLERALHWIATSGDPDGDGLVEYQRQTPRGLAQQGWKDSQDSVFHADGTLAQGPIALCEVQAYVHAAWTEAARLALILGREEQAQSFLRKAQTLRARFDELFWCEEISTYALALDGEKRPCKVRSSNAGQCLLTTFASPERARRVARTLLDDDGFSGWGIRTLAAGEVRYNPMSYHNGSVWPHDNALIALGLSRHGLQKDVLTILTGLFEASRYVDLHRLPELYCGFPRRLGEGPTLYPVACAPQAWAAGAVLLSLQAALGLQIDGQARRVTFRHPCLPDFLERVWIRNLRVGNATTDITLVNHRHDVGIQVLRREGALEIVTVK